ncbi:MarR family winged helix-turn-helix transcriptional regulator [Uliginosibacterium sp. H3]|uniref:MarR family winged helix-turn-helix transcriptional regulator n=1 Tax=Uliginosibacterium silvisoli TaxID=3114758 RepID=A0ABU6K7A9_9RHOO|nr:MarR family winged helix-turn-helix transcriptional regulator [Uliginosibacterium sp. H3]
MSQERTQQKTQRKQAREDSAVLREAMRLFIQAQRRVLAEQGSPPQARLLIMLLRRGTMTQAEFGRLLGLEKSWVSRSVDKLVEQGWVIRSPVPADRRNMQLELTATGTSAAREMDDYLNAHAMSVLDHLSAESRPAVVGALQQLCEALRKHDDATGS